MNSYSARSIIAGSIFTARLTAGADARRAVNSNTAAGPTNKISKTYLFASTTRKARNAAKKWVGNLLREG
jgi:hypothetical protein